MKRLLLLLMVAVAFASCEGPEGPQGPPGEDGAGFYWDELTFQVAPNDWKQNGEEGGNDFYLYVEKSWNIITDNVVDHGAVVGYIYEPAHDEYFTLPHVIHQIDDYEWTQTISLGFSPGRLTLTLRNTDARAFAPDNTITFRAVVIQ